MEDLFDMPNLAEALKMYGDYLVEEYRKNLKESGHFASGKLYSSLHTEIVAGGNTYDVNLYLEDYYKYVEHGRMAGNRPPINKILDWIRIKPVLPRPDKNGKLPTEEQLAFLISRSIGRIGSPGKDGLPVEPTHDLQRAMETTHNYYLGLIEQAIDKDLSEHYESLLRLVIV